MRWLAVGVFLVLSVTFLLRRGSAKSRAKARRRLKRHMGMPAGEKQSVPARRLLSKCGWLDRTRYVQGLHAQFERAGIRVSWERFKLIWLSAVLALPALAYAVSGSPLVVPPALLAALILPVPLLKSCGRRAKRETSEKWDRFAAELALYLRCGIPAEEAAVLLAADYGPTLSAQLARFEQEAAASRSGEALRDLAGSLGNPDLDLIARAVIASRETGSDIRGVMEAVGEALRERAAIRRELDTQTIQSRLSGRIVAALPLVFLCLSALVSRGTLSALFGTLPGLVMLAVALLLDLLGFLWIRRILDIKT